VCYTADTDDLTQADAYMPHAQYVWLICPSIELRDDFPLSWIPDDTQQFNVQAFPVCKERGKSVVRWDAVRLVSTDPAHRQYEIRQREIAAYDKNRYSVFFVSTGQADVVEKYQAHRRRFPNATLIREPATHVDMLRSAARGLYSGYAWIIDLDVDLPPTVNLHFQPANGTNNSYVWSQTATGNEVMPYGVSLFTHNYVSNRNVTSIVNITDQEIGKQ
jgi:hypothetical protein